MGDHMIFTMRGIPAIAIIASNTFSPIGTLVHTPDDNMKNIDFGILENIVNFLLCCNEEALHS